MIGNCGIWATSKFGFFGFLFYFILGWTSSIHLSMTEGAYCVLADPDCLLAVPSSSCQELLSEFFLHFSFLTTHASA